MGNIGWLAGISGQDILTFRLKVIISPLNGMLFYNRLCYRYYISSLQKCTSDTPIKKQKQKNSDLISVKKAKKSTDKLEGDSVAKKRKTN